MVTWLSNYSYPITAFCNWTPTLLVRQSVVFKWVIFCCFPPTFKPTENILDVLSTRVHIDFFSNFVIDVINW